YVGWGYRYWFNDGESSSSYERNIRYSYSPIGIEGTIPLNENWCWGMRAEYNLFWKGWVKSHLSDVDPAYNDADNTQDTGFGVRGSLYFKRSVESGILISIEPFIQYWDVDDSDISPDGGYEPANRTLESGLQLSIGF
ncbi:MAG: hypothetical protein ABH845_04990, partial [Candidatus Omnitrophota bacterium]